MLNWLKNKILGVVLNKYVGGWVVDLYKKLEGLKTQVITGVILVLTGLYVSGNLDHETWKNACEALAAAAGITLMDKLHRHKSVLDSLRGLNKKDG